MEEPCTPVVEAWQGRVQLSQAELVRLADRCLLAMAGLKGTNLGHVQEPCRLWSALRAAQQLLLRRAPDRMGQIDAYDLLIPSPPCDLFVGDGNGGTRHLRPTALQPASELQVLGMRLARLRRGLQL